MRAGRKPVGFLRGLISYCLRLKTNPANNCWLRSWVWKCCGTPWAGRPTKKASCLRRSTWKSSSRWCLYAAMIWGSSSSRASAAGWCENCLLDVAGTVIGSWPPWPCNCSEQPATCVIMVSVMSELWYMQSELRVKTNLTQLVSVKLGQCAELSDQ